MSCITFAGRGPSGVYNVSRKRRLEKRSRSAGAAVRPFDELDAMLVALPAIRYRYGTTHGDLHGNNVRIAGADAILIDFASVDYGPLTVILQRWTCR